MSIPNRQEAIEDLSMFGIKEPYTYLLDIVPLVEMIWADGEAHESELAVLDEYLHKRFNIQVGAGTHYFLSDRTSLTVQCRCLRFSNACIERPNHGTNTQVLEIGVSWFF